MQVVTAAEMREMDRITIEDVGIAGVVLMENAGRAVADKVRELCDVLTHEKELLTANRPEALPDVLEQQKRILHDAKRLEPERMGALRDVSAWLGSTSTLTLTELAAALEGDARTRIEKLRSALSHVVPRVDQINRINVMLIRNSMSFISTTVRAILEEGPERGVTYAASGQAAETTSRTSWTDRHA